MKDPMQNIVDGLLGAPESIIRGINEILSTVDDTINPNSAVAQHHIKNLNNFVSFLGQVPFNNAVNKMASIAVPYILNEHKDECEKLIIGSGIRFGSNMAAKQAIVTACINSVTDASHSGAQKAVMRRGLKSIVYLITAADCAGKSGNAADRLKKKHPKLYDALDSQGLIGGYFLIEEPINTLKSRLNYI